MLSFFIFAVCLGALFINPPRVVPAKHDFFLLFMLHSKALFRSTHCWWSNLASVSHSNSTFPADVNGSVTIPTPKLADLSTFPITWEFSGCCGVVTPLPCATSITINTNNSNSDRGASKFWFAFYSAFGCTWVEDVARVWEEAESCSWWGIRMLSDTTIEDCSAKLSSVEKSFQLVLFVYIYFQFEWRLIAIHWPLHWLIRGLHYYYYSHHHHLLLVPLIFWQEQDLSQVLGYGVGQLAVERPTESGIKNLFPQAPEMHLPYFQEIMSTNSNDATAIHCRESRE